MSERGRPPTFQSVTEELALEVMALAREDARRALELKRLATRFVEMSRSHGAEAVAS